jgi:hypothetical protein
MVFHTVIGSKILAYKPAWKFLGNDSPFVAYLVVQSVKLLLLFFIPF